VVVVSRLKMNNAQVVRRIRQHENVSKINELIRENRRLTSREISDALTISFDSVQLVLTKNLNMRRVSAKFVPRLLSQEQKEFRLSISLELHNRANSNSGFLRSLITGDESWVYGYDPETKMESSHWNSNQSKSNVKVVLNVFFDIEGIV
jgi:hypothetical protein